MANLCVGCDIEIAIELVNLDFISLFVKIIDDNDIKIIQSSLEAINSLFNHGEIIKINMEVNPFAKQFKEHLGIQKLEKLQKTKNNHIHTLCIKILDSFFKEEIDNKMISN